MRTSKLKRLLAEGKPVAGTMITDLPCPETVRAIARAGFDFLVVDNEHAPIGLETNTALYREALAADIDMLVRVPDAAYHLIARTLDAGTDGIMVPRVETREQAELVVQAAKYPPQGGRGCGQRPVYTGQAGVPIAEYTEHLNANTTVMVQIESQQALACLDDIVAVAGIDIALIGPADLSISLGVPGQVDHPLMLAAVDQVVETCRRAGMAPGIHWADTAYLRRVRERGMSVIMCWSDLGMLGDGARRARGALEL